MIEFECLAHLNQSQGINQTEILSQHTQTSLPDTFQIITQKVSSEIQKGFKLCKTAFTNLLR